ncbi:MAG TPA: hypothetical protein VFU69_07300 [Ktedonobacterales bacterium]|nr:hypothetical protein [Ktedonobacterales bacterium]
MESYIDGNPPSSKFPARLISISIILLITYAVALFVALMLSINWLAWVLVALGMGISIPVLLLAAISFALWIHGKARANDLEVGPEAIEGCLGVFFFILEGLLSHW